MAIKFLNSGIFTGSVSATDGFTTVSGKGYSIANSRIVYYDGTTYLGNIDNQGTGSTIIRSGGINSLDLSATGAANFASSVSATTFLGASVTQAAGNNSTLIATTAYADAAAGAVPIGNYVTLATAQTISGSKTFNDGPILNGSIYWRVSSADAALQRADARDDGTNFSRLHWYGVSDAGATSNFRHAWYDGANYINVTAASQTVTFSGALAASNLSNTNTGDNPGVTSVGISHAGDAFTTSAAITTTGTLAITMAGASTQYINGLGNLVTFPSIPQGDITGVTAGTYMTGGGTSGTVTLNADGTKLAHITGSANAAVGPGWMTVASSATGRQAGEIYVTDGDSSDHAFIRIDWMRSYVDSNFTVLNCGGHANRITGIRVLAQAADTTYGPKYLQVYVTVASTYYVIVTQPGSIPAFGDLTAVTPVIQNTITGYSLTGSELTGLDTSSIATDEGITIGGNLYAKGTANFASSVSATTFLGASVTQTAGNNSTLIATTAYVDAAAAVLPTASSLYDLLPNGRFTTTYAFTSVAGTYSQVMSGSSVITSSGTYSVQVVVNDYGVGGTQYNEYYSGVMTWFATSTNQGAGGAISEIILHRAGHAANSGVIYLRTRETTSSESNTLKLEVMSNKTYTSASNLIFKFVRLI